jgi:hypothetical protein
MSTSAMTTTTKSPTRSPRPDTLGWLTRHDPVPVVGWSDPVIDALGHDPRSGYVELFWLPILGPSCTLAARRLAGWVEAEPEGFPLSLGPFARSLGLGDASERHAPIHRTLAGLAGFGMARLGGSSFAVRRTFPPLAARQIERLPEHVAHQHAGWVARTEPAAIRGADR